MNYLQKAVACKGFANLQIQWPIHVFQQSDVVFLEHFGNPPQKSIVEDQFCVYVKLKDI
jgi:hypothetical protein